METVTSDTIHRDLEFVKGMGLMEMRWRIVDTDRIITEDDSKALQEHNMEQSEGSLILLCHITDKSVTLQTNQQRAVA